MKFQTKLIHSGSKPNLKEGGSGDVVVPIHLSTTFARIKVDVPTNGYDYSRSGNPTRSALEENLAALENAQYGLAYASGLAAMTNILFLLKTGDHVVSIDDVYGGTWRLFKRAFEQFGIEFTFAPFKNGEELKPFLQKNTKMVWIESPTNPLLKLVDIASVALVAREKSILTVVDNTFATPVLQQPLDMGADIVVHSLTKYISGHSDVVGGAVMLNDSKIAEKLKFLQNAIGAILSPFDSFQVLKGIKTLSLRMRQHEENAKKVVAYLKQNQSVVVIFYPGFGGMVSFEIKGTLKQSVDFLESLTLISIAESLGSAKSLIEHPASMTHASVPKEEREKIGLKDGLIRLSVGLEDVSDIIEDLEQAFKGINIK